jgi:hypothetical protein
VADSRKFALCVVVVMAAVFAGGLAGGFLGADSKDAVTVTETVAIPGPQVTETVIREVNPPLSPPKGRFGVAPGAVVGTVRTKGPWAGYTVWFVSWSSVANAASYRLWIDGKVSGDQAATPGATQGITVPVRCGVKHTFNVQVRNAAGEIGPKRKTATTFTPKPC